MDVLSELLRVVRLEGALFFNGEFSSPWCLSSSPPGMAPYLYPGARHLIIYHFIPREKLTKRYHRSWCFWQSVSSAVLDRIRPQPTPYVWGVPRYFYGRAFRGMLQLANLLNREPASRFSNELSLWELAGFFYGKHFYRPDS